MIVGCFVIDNACVIVDFFGDECSDDAVAECREFRPEVPLGTQFDSADFSAFCR